MFNAQGSEGVIVFDEIQGEMSADDAMLGRNEASHVQIVRAPRKLPIFTCRSLAHHGKSSRADWPAPDRNATSSCEDGPAPVKIAKKEQFSSVLPKNEGIRRQSHINLPETGHKFPLGYYSQAFFNRHSPLPTQTARASCLDNRSLTIEPCSFSPLYFTTYRTYVHRYPDLFLRPGIVVPVFLSQQFKMRPVVEPVS
ncbi:MAG: hypothetical protein JWP27_1938 [Flaviaesturariibacter sp.]|nr:hypothetical protein [Flaviaesturariibacter sp.]